MNLIAGSIWKAGVFSAAGTSKVEGLDAWTAAARRFWASGRRIATSTGRRPSDRQVFGIEPTGDQTFVSLRTDDTLIEIKGGPRLSAHPLDTSTPRSALISTASTSSTPLSGERLTR